MKQSDLERVNTLTFDLFGTVLDLAGSLVPAIDGFLQSKSASISGADFWTQWRGRQRIEQYQDNILMLGHSGYLAVCKYAFLYTLRANQIEFTDDEVDDFMQVWQQLRPFGDAVEGLARLKSRYRLVGLSNGESWFLEHLAKNQIQFEFDGIFSAEQVGCFKPDPTVYRTAAKTLSAEPGEIMMVASHAFDILGARACGFRGAYVNRYGLPCEESPYQPDITVVDFHQLANYLLQGDQPDLPDVIEPKEE